jgi:hypothetical protein
MSNQRTLDYYFDYRQRGGSRSGGGNGDNAGNRDTNGSDRGTGGSNRDTNGSDRVREPVLCFREPTSPLVNTALGLMGYQIPQVGFSNFGVLEISS